MPATIAKFQQLLTKPTLRLSLSDHPTPPAFPGYQQLPRLPMTPSFRTQPDRVVWQKSS